MTQNEKYTEILNELEKLGLGPRGADPWDIDQDTELWGVWFGEDYQNGIAENTDGALSVSYEYGADVKEFKTLHEALDYIRNKRAAA